MGGSVSATRVFVVTEAYGASAVAEVFASWEMALAHAFERFANFRGCDETTTEIGPEHAALSAKWDPGTDQPDVARRVDISIWAREVRT